MFWSVRMAYNAPPSTSHLVVISWLFSHAWKQAFYPGVSWNHPSGPRKARCVIYLLLTPVLTQQVKEVRGGPSFSLMIYILCILYFEKQVIKAVIFCQSTVNPGLCLVPVWFPAVFRQQSPVVLSITHSDSTSDAIQADLSELQSHYYHC